MSVDLLLVRSLTPTAGTFEIALGPEAPLRAADSFVVAQDIIKTVCQRYKLFATMIPKPFSEDDPFAPNRRAVQGVHAHVSVDPINKEDEEAFLAGILKSLPALCALGMASIDSYIRCHDSTRAATGQWIGWGTQNRDMPVRKIEAGHFEVRVLDGTANMYLALAAAIAAGLQGIATLAGEQLEWRDCLGNPLVMTEAERSAHGIRNRLPQTLSEALEALVLKTNSFQKYISSDLLKDYHAIKSREVEVTTAMTTEQRRLLYAMWF